MSEEFKDELIRRLTRIEDKLDIAMSEKPNESEAETEIIDVTQIVMTYDANGQVMYHAKGGRYQKHGARIWPEVMINLPINTESLKPGPNAWQGKLIVRTGPGVKVISLAE